MSVRVAAVLSALVLLLVGAGVALIAGEDEPAQRESRGELAMPAVESGRTGGTVDLRGDLGTKDGAPIDGEPDGAAAIGSGDSELPAGPAVDERDLLIDVEGGRPARGVIDLEVRQGADVTFTVTADAAEEVHVHGYDLTALVRPDSPARFSFPAVIAGIFEIELEGSGTQIAELTVTP